VAESALIIAVPDVEPLVAAVRARHDSSAAAGVPAHITLLYPFLAPDAITSRDLAALTRIFDSTRAFDVTFRECRRFGARVLWLAPDPDAPFVTLTRQIFERWPECPPYRGAIPSSDVIPHLTVSDTVEGAPLDRVERTIASGLPVTTHVDEALLIENRDGRWRTRERFRFL
jgi:hypothetical protein